MTTMNAKRMLNHIKLTGMSFAKYTLGSVEENVSDSLCLYKRSGTAARFEYGKNNSTVYPLGIVYTGTKNYNESENKVEELYESLVFGLHEEYDEADDETIYFSVLPHNNATPIYIGKNEAGFYQFSIDFDIQHY